MNDIDKVYSTHLQNVWCINCTLVKYLWQWNNQLVSFIENFSSDKIWCLQKNKTVIHFSTQQQQPLLLHYDYHTNYNQYYFYFSLTSWFLTSGTCWITTFHKTECPSCCQNSVKQRTVRTTMSVTVMVVLTTVDYASDLNAHQWAANNRKLRVSALAAANVITNDKV